MANREPFTVGSFNLEFYQALESSRNSEEVSQLGTNGDLQDASAEISPQAVTESNATGEHQSVDKKQIKTLDNGVTKKICTGQVIISLAGL